MADELTEKIIGAAIDVHRELGRGFRESVYEAALCCELDLRGIAYERQKPIDILYKGNVIKGQRLDLVVAGEVVVEIKSTAGLPEVAVPQTISYLKAANLQRGLIVNFNENRLVDGVKRVSV